MKEQEYSEELIRHIEEIGLSTDDYDECIKLKGNISMSFFLDVAPDKCRKIFCCPRREHKL